MRRVASPEAVQLVWTGKGRSELSPPDEGARGRLATVERVPARGEGLALAAGSVPPNRLVLGDNLAALSLLADELAGRVDLVSIDLPFASGGDYRAKLRLGADPGRRGSGRVLAYRDRWGASLAGYLTMLEPRLRLVHQLLSARGSAYVHVDQRASAVVRLLLEELFGRPSFVNELVWAYRTGGTPGRLGFAKKHDTILFFAKDPARAIFHPPREKSRLAHRYGFKNVEILEDEAGPYTWVKGRDVMEVPALRGNQPERVDYPTQKPEALIERFVLASSEPGSLVLDCFAGSGTALVVAERLGRRWVGCDLSPHAVAVARKRLLALPSRAPFEVLAVRHGDAPVFPSEAPRVEARGRVDGRTATIELTGIDYLRPRELPASVTFERAAFADFVDSWAVGWDCPDGVPRADWVACRSRTERSLPLCTAPHRYPEGGRHEVVVSVVDVFGAVGSTRLSVELAG